MVLYTDRAKKLRRSHPLQPGEEGADSRRDTAYGFFNPKPHSHILAITFTKKATQEMTDRIIKELAKLADPETVGASSYFEHLCQTYGLSPVAEESKQKLCKAASQALSSLLFYFSTFNVATIDSFFQNVLRIFTRELDLADNFNLEIDDSYAVSVAVGKMFSLINIPTADAEQESRKQLLVRWMEAYMRACLEDGKNPNVMARSSKMYRDLVDTLGSLRTEEYRRRIHEFKQYFQKPERLQELLNKFRGELKKEELFLQEESKKFASYELSEYVAKTIKETTFDLWKEGYFENYFLRNGQDKLRNPIVSALQEDGKRFNNLPAKVSLDAEVDAMLLRLLRRGKDYFIRMRLYNLMRSNIYLLGLFSMMEKTLDDNEISTGSFLLSNTNQLLRRVIFESEVPFVYERLGTTINHYLIDEFQDTSEMQWDNLYPLVEESMSTDNDNLIIGDEKQCIYRFRNSKPELLGSVLRETFHDPAQPDLVSIEGDRLAHNTNYRSAPNVVKFNNTLFFAIPSLLDKKLTFEGGKLLDSTYSTIIQKVRDWEKKDRENFINPDGYVKIILGLDSTDAKKVKTGEPDENGVPAKKVIPFNDDAQIRRMVKEIDRELSSGYSMSDIAILVRSHNEGEKVINHLLQLDDNAEGWHHGRINIISDDALKVSSSQAVQVIIGLLRLTTTPEFVNVPISQQKNYNGALPAGTEKIQNPVFLRNKLINRYTNALFTEICYKRPLTDSEGRETGEFETVTRRLTRGEALGVAVNALALEPADGEFEKQTEPHPTLQSALDEATREMCNFNVLAAAAEDEQYQGQPTRKTTETPSIFALVEKIIRENLTEKIRRDEQPSISAFQDLVLDFEETGGSNVDDFLDWWDTKGKKVKIPAPEKMNAIRVMTIHQSKGLEFKCVHIPFCQNSVLPKEKIRWYKLDPEDFKGVDPELVPPMIPFLHTKKYDDIAIIKEQYDKYTAEQTVDLLNTMYVAYTRAVEELIVYSCASMSDPQADPSKKYNNFGQMLRCGLKISLDELRAIDKHEEAAERSKYMVDFAAYKTETSISETDKEGVETELKLEIFEFGKPSVASQQQLDRWQMKRENENVANQYDADYKTYTVYKPIDLVTSDNLDDIGGYNVDNDRHRGNFLHAALSMVRNVGDLDRAMDRTAYRMGVPESERWKLQEKLSEALADQRVRPWFEGYDRVLSERSISGLSDDKIRRPDRVVFLPTGEIAVIDYKFGAFKECYRKQVRHYIKLLGNCGYPITPNDPPKDGYTHIRGYIFLPLENRIIPV